MFDLDRNVHALKEISMKPKQKRYLLSGKKAGDADELAKLFEKLTGHRPSPQEIDEARKILSAPDEPMVRH